jgi:hypothetical protein
MKNKWIVVASVLIWWISSIITWFAIHFTHGNWAFFVYLLLFPLIQLSQLGYFIQGWLLLGVMIAYGTTMALLFSCALERKKVHIAVIAHVILVLIVLATDKEWSYR